MIWAYDALLAVLGYHRELAKSDKIKIINYFGVKRFMGKISLTEYRLVMEELDKRRIADSEVNAFSEVVNEIGINNRQSTMVRALDIVQERLQIDNTLVDTREYVIDRVPDHFSTCSECKVFGDIHNDWKCHLSACVYKSARWPNRCRYCGYIGSALDPFSHHAHCQFADVMFY